MHRFPTLVLFALLGVSSGTLAGPLAEAARDRQFDRALELLGQGADANDHDEDGTTALQWAVHHDSAVLVDRLLAARADVRRRNDYGATALAEAAVVGNVAVAERLLRAGRIRIRPTPGARRH